MKLEKLKKVDQMIWRIPKYGEMNVDGEIIATEKMIREMDDKVYEQLVNVASLPGIERKAVAMPDAHWGYGFPIGGVGAFREEDGIVSVGGVGFDGGCGVRLYSTSLSLKDVNIKLLIDKIYKRIPAGLGSRGEIQLDTSELFEVLVNGAQYVIRKGYGKKDDIDFIEDKGKIDYADPSKVSSTAIQREKKQIGTLGSGNHYLEINYIAQIFNKDVAEIYNLRENQICVLIHCGSRALGHQIATDFLKILGLASKKYNIKIRDRELVCAPLTSKEGKDFLAASACAMNYAYANRQVIGGLVEDLLRNLYSCEVNLVWDLTHNSCRKELHSINGENVYLYVHRKGATRAFGPSRKELPLKYQKTGQPVLIGGSMGTCSWVLRGTEIAEKLCFASAAHGAGRAMSRTQATKRWGGKEIIEELERKGILVRAHDLKGVAEEAPMAYKDVNEVVDVLHETGIAEKVALLKPLACLKG
jgi:tRNA-splicing ligase RtcB